ncbi:MAG: hypothetical protein H0X51_06120 [Parachlamydiaceae bacterium]|nr:hypothetical protein [Parachlamydiaceae bacterium]
MEPAQIYQSNVDWNTLPESLDKSCIKKTALQRRINAVFALLAVAGLFASWKSGAILVASAMFSATWSVVFFGAAFLTANFIGTILCIGCDKTSEELAKQRRDLGVEWHKNPMQSATAFQQDNPRFISTEDVDALMQSQITYYGPEKTKTLYPDVAPVQKERKA